MESPEARRERRLKARAERERQAVAGRQKAQRRRRLTIGGIVLLGLALLAAGATFASQSLFRPSPGRLLPDEGRSHVNPGTPLEFKSVPPTSGAHYPANWTRSGIYPETQNPGNWVHSLEHGYVVVLYNCPDGCSEDVDKLRQFYEAAPKSSRFGYQKLIIHPYSTMPRRFAAVAWARLDAMDEFDLDRLGAFYRAYFDRGPEDAP
jgi:hypothetical protein